MRSCRAAQLVNHVQLLIESYRVIDKKWGEVRAMSIYAGARPRILKYCLLLITYGLVLIASCLMLNAHPCTYKGARTAGLSALYEHL